jgi:hypothetical protein
MVSGALLIGLACLMFIYWFLFDDLIGGLRHRLNVICAWAFVPTATIGISFVVVGWRRLRGR